MVDSWSLSEDRLTYSFTLRDGLKFHDGKPVTSEDCIASIKRWGARDFDRRQADELRGKLQGGRRQDLRVGAEGALRTGARFAGQAGQLHTAHHAQAHRRHRSRQADRRDRGLGPLHLQEGRVEAGRAHRLCAQSRLQATARAAVGPGRRQGGQGRPGRMARHPRSPDRGQRPAGRRDRLYRGAAARSEGAAAGRQEHPAGGLQHDWRAICVPLEHSGAAVQRRARATRGDVRLQPGSLPEGSHRRREVLQDVRGHVRLRHAAREQRRHGGPAAPTSPSRRRS